MVDSNRTRIGVNSKDRIKEYGEVYTGDNTVNEMLDELDNEISNISDLEYIRKIYLEPTCGNGNFIIRILDRKLDRVVKFDRRYRDILVLTALSSIHGIDILPDNVNNTKRRMVEIIENGSTDIMIPERFKDRTRGFNTLGGMKDSLSDDMRNSIKYILDSNIQLGNFKTGEKYLINTNTGESVSGLGMRLVLKQYDFCIEKFKVAIRERSLDNMSCEVENYTNVSEYVDYHKVYELGHTNILYDEKFDVVDDYNF